MLLTRGSGIMVNLLIWLPVKAGMIFRDSQGVSILSRGSR